MVFVKDVNVELSFQSVMNVDDGSDVSDSFGISEFSLKSDWDTLPSKRVHFSESFSHTVNYSLGSDSRLIRLRFSRRSWVSCRQSSS